MEPGPIQQMPHTPVAAPMGDADDRTSNVAALPHFHGRNGSDPEWHMSTFLTACLANNARNEEIWLRWFPSTLKDVAFQWYNRQPPGHFPNWGALRTAILNQFRPVGRYNTHATAHH